MEEAQQFEALRGLQNYLSVTEQVEAAELEIKRYEDKGFVKRMPWSQVTSTLGTQGTVSYAELGIISDASHAGVPVHRGTSSDDTGGLGGSSYERGSKDVGSGVWVLIFAGCDGDVCGFEVKSDSTVALAIVDRLSSPTKELN